MTKAWNCEPEMNTDQDWRRFQLDQDWIGLWAFFLFECEFSEHNKNFSCHPISQIFQFWKS